MHKDYTGNTDGAIDLENYYQDFVLPEFGIKKPVVWERHVKTDPDNFLHIFKVGNVKYALAFDDYPSGFSVGRDKSVKAVRLSDGENILDVDSPSGKYGENITGAFMLFQVINVDDFEKRADYLEASYAKLHKKWESGGRSVVVIARDVLQLAETASQNHDTAALYSLSNIVETFAGLDVEDNNVEIKLLDEYLKILLDAEYDYEFYTADDKIRTQEEIYKTLSKEIQNTIKIQKYEADNLGQAVTLVNAMYAKVGPDMTEGITMTILFENNEIKYPVDHFVNDALRKYFAERPYITENNIEYNMPETLHGYRLVAGSESIQKVFPRELAYISY